MSLSFGGKLIVAASAMVLGAVVGLVDAVQTTLELPAALLLASGVLLGALNPRLAWVWAAVMGLCLVSARAVADLFDTPSPYTSALLPLILLPLGVAVFGILAGTVLRRLTPDAR